MFRARLIGTGMSIAAHLGYPVAKTVQFLHDSENWSRRQLQEHQGKALHALMEHCYHHVPYYQRLMKERGLVPAEFQKPDDVSKLPYLTREIIREQSDALRATNYPDSQCQLRRSGGTTGEPIQVAADTRARAFEVAAYLRGFEWMGYKLGQPMIRLFGGSLGLPQKRSVKARLREWSFNSRFLPAFELTPSNTAEYVSLINRTPNAVLVGYASAVRNLAEFVASQNLQVTKLKSIICTAEYMPDEWRTYISNILGAPVFCYYGCGEINSIAYESAGEEGYLVTGEHLILETAQENDAEFITEGRGQACVTTLYNYAMPLIRYLNGDMLELEQPSVGRGHLRITKLEGRVVDQLLTQHGNKISGALVPHIVFRSGFPAWKYQVVQIGRDEINFHYRLTNGVRLTEQVKEPLVQVLRQHLGPEVNVNFVDGNFDVSKSGKHRFVINRLHS